MDKERVMQWLETVYIVCFTVGVRSIRCLKSLMRITRLLWAPIARLLHRAVDWLLLRHMRRLRNECRRMINDYRLVSERMQDESIRGRYRAVLQWLTIPILAVRRHRGAFHTVCNVVFPLLATAGLLLTVRYWTSARFVLALEYEGTPIGYIADEGVYANAAAMVRDSVINADDSFVVSQAPTMRVEVLGTVAPIGEREVSNRIMDIVDKDLTTAAGLYVDGVFYGALPTSDELQAKMSAVLSAHQTDGIDGVDFFAHTEIKVGRYPVSALVTSDQMTERLQKLDIKTVRNIQYTEVVKYKTVYRKTDTEPLGYERLLQKGRDGSQRVYAQEIFVNGVKKYQTVVSTETIKPVAYRIFLVGAQTYDEGTELGDGKATGKFVWPLPYTKQISSYFANRWGRLHGAIDISNGSTNGKPIIASDGGVVIEAQFNGSWGNYVLIDHGNGFKTRYAHCSKLEVKAGDKVAQGQYIAKVGSTGYSTGPHLHFEVIKDGVLVDPLKYVQR